MYVVRMKQVTASEARKHWFRLLDEAAAGEVIAIERKGRRIVLRREDGARVAATARPASRYRRVLNVRDVDQADRWSWQWRGPGRDLAPRPGRAG
jgi:antitoxin (DNA-binding transcriptional repressor) of toxin-antitoxin stability system